MQFPASAWDTFLTQFPNPHLLQTADWGELKAAFGWDVERVVMGNCGAQILFRSLPLGFSLAYIPKGPLGKADAAFWRKVDATCRRKKAVFLKLEPDAWDTEVAVPPDGFRLSLHAIQPPRTVVVDLAGDEDAVLARMKQKTRYNIKLAQKKGVIVKPLADLDLFKTLMDVTGGRDGFEVHSLDYYRRAYTSFRAREACELLVAEFDGEPLAALMVFAHGNRAWYLYGASADSHRERMPTYLLQWEAMRWARGRGCLEYDLWGVPDEDEATLEAQFADRSDGLWGVYRFKRGFGGVLKRSAGPWDRVYNPLAYRAYRLWLKARKSE